MEKISYFDFCGTLVNFQTADEYVRYVKSKVKINSRMLFVDYVRKALLKCRIMILLQAINAEGYLNKKILLYQLKGLDYDTLDELAKKYYYDRIKPNLINVTVNELRRLKSEGYLIYIVSAGYDIYLKYAQEDIGVDGVIATKLDFNGKVFTGRYQDKDCLSNNKLEMLKDYLVQKNIEGENAIAYSDSESDLPLLEYCTKGVVVCQRVPEWAIENKMEVLLWE